MSTSKRKRKYGGADQAAHIPHVGEAPSVAPVLGAVKEDEKTVAKSLREGGLVASPDEILFTLGSAALVADSAALAAAVSSLSAAQDPDEWFTANYETIRGVVFVPAQPRVARAFPLLGVKSKVAPGSHHSWPVKNHMPGLHVLVGGTGAGKSTWLARHELDVIVRWGEPTEMYDNQANTVPAADIVEALAVAMVLSGAGYKVAIDSFRNLVFGLEGAAGQGGVSVALYSSLTSLNNLFAQLGLLIIAAVNPMSTEDKAQLVYNNIAASVAGMTVVDRGTVVSQTARTTTGRKIGSVDSGQPAEVGMVHPRATQVAQPDTLERGPRIDSRVVEVSDVEEIEEPGRTGGKLAF